MKSISTLLGLQNMENKSGGPQVPDYPPKSGSDPLGLDMDDLFDEPHTHDTKTSDGVEDDLGFDAIFNQGLGEIVEPCISPANHPPDVATNAYMLLAILGVTARPVPHRYEVAGPGGDDHLRGGTKNQGYLHFIQSAGEARASHGEWSEFLNGPLNPARDLFGENAPVTAAFIRAALKAQWSTKRNAERVNHGDPGFCVDFVRKVDVGNSAHWYAMGDAPHHAHDSVGLVQSGHIRHLPGSASMIPLEGGYIIAVFATPSMKRPGYNTNDRVVSIVTGRGGALIPAKKQVLKDIMQGALDVDPSTGGLRAIFKTASDGSRIKTLENYIAAVYPMHHQVDCPMVVLATLMLNPKVTPPAVSAALRKTLQSALESLGMPECDTVSGLAGFFPYYLILSSFWRHDRAAWRNVKVAEFAAELVDMGMLSALLKSAVTTRVERVIGDSAVANIVFSGAPAVSGRETSGPPHKKARHDTLPGF